MLADDRPQLLGRAFRIPQLDRKHDHIDGFGLRGIAEHLDGELCSAERALQREPLFFSAAKCLPRAKNGFVPRLLQPGAEVTPRRPPPSRLFA